MNLQTLLDNKHITKYHLSKISGVPKTTVIDIFSGKSDISHCSAKTIQQLAKALDCPMECIMDLETPASKKSKYDIDTGLPIDKEYLECNLPGYLQKSIEKMLNIITGKKVPNVSYSEARVNRSSSKTKSSIPLNAL